MSVLNGESGLINVGEGEEKEGVNISRGGEEGYAENLGFFKLFTSVEGWPGREDWIDASN